MATAIESTAASERGSKVTASTNFPARYIQKYSQNSKSVGAARRSVVEFAKTCGFGARTLADIEAAVGEALANAVEHGSRGAGSFEVHTYRDTHALTIEVKDSGRGFDHAPVAGNVAPPAESLRGFGTFIMRNFMDEIEYSERGTRVRLVKRLPAACVLERPAREA